MCVSFTNYSIEMVFRAVSFSRKDLLWGIGALAARTAFVWLRSRVGRCVRSLQCWYIAQNLKDPPVSNSRQTKHFTISFHYCNLKMCSFHQRPKPEILLEKYVKRWFLQPASPSAGIHRECWMPSSARIHWECWMPCRHLTWCPTTGGLLPLAPPKTKTIFSRTVPSFLCVGASNPYGVAALDCSGFER